MMRIPLLLLLLPALSGCGAFLTDAATRFRFDVQSEAALLLQSGAASRTFTHRFYRFPEGCRDGYRLEVAAADRRRTIATNDVYVGCYGNRRHEAGHYTFATGLGEPLLPVVPPLVVENPRSGDLRVTLLREEQGVRIVAIEPGQE